MDFGIENHTIFKGISGSHAYGLATPESDYDYRGIAIPPKKYFLGFASGFDQHIKLGEVDLTIFDIRKFFQLAVDCNPNIIELLWLPERCVQMRTPWSDMLMEHRKLFLSTKAKHTFSGYAIAQLKRIKGHRRWLLNPPKEKPSRTTYGLPEVSTISESIRNVLRAAESADIALEGILSPPTIEVALRERAFFEAQREWENYEKWRTERNPKRAALEERFGYDTKHAMHLVRLMRMAREILTKGEVIVERPDSEELIAIRNGEWEYDALLEWAEQQDQELEKLYQSCVLLPKSANIKKLNALCMEIVEDFLGMRRV